jgi:short subunit dehydrogenase-like uncharacterized protein
MTNEAVDVVLFGPTGVTGREVARHLARRAPALGLTWGVAGRDRAKVERVLAGLPSQPQLVLQADSADPGSIDAMARSATVIANLVGPYARHGEVVYAACIRHGTHQLDLTGEVDWLARMIEVHGDAAGASAAKIVPTAGFEALPFDLGALLAALTASQRAGAPVATVDIAVTMSGSAPVRSPADAVSGGTFVSGVEALRRGTGPAFSDPYLLDPPGSGASGSYELGPRRHAGTGAWLGPMVPSPFLNPPIAHRSAALLRADGDPTFAPDFRYREGLTTTGSVPGALAPLAAATLSSFQASLGLVSRAPAFVRGRIADTLLALGPRSGDGPDPGDLDAWSYRLDVRATTTTGVTADVVVEADGHPGYKSTATMVGEAALVLADAAAPLPERNGFLTPATALGPDVIGRFDEAGARFRVTG